MQQYEKITEAVIEELKAIVGEKYVLTTPRPLKLIKRIKRRIHAFSIHLKLS